MDAAALSIGEAETAAERLERAVSENPVVVLSRTQCCMCHVARRLLATVGVHPTVVEVADGEVEGLVSPAVFIGGELVGGLETLMGLHIAGGLVARLRQVGALWVDS